VARSVRRTYSRFAPASPSPTPRTSSKRASAAAAHRMRLEHAGREVLDQGERQRLRAGGVAARRLQEALRDRGRDPRPRARREVARSTRPIEARLRRALGVGEAAPAPRATVVAAGRRAPLL